MATMLQRIRGWLPGAERATDNVEGWGKRQNEEDDEDALSEAGVRGRDDTAVKERPRRKRLTEQVFSINNPDAGTEYDDRFFKALNTASVLDLSPKAIHTAQRLSALLYRKNVRALRSIEMTKDFVVGDGVKVVASDKKVQDLLDAFWTANRWDEKLPERVVSLALMGEALFPAFINPRTALVRISNITPLRIQSVNTNPKDADETVSVRVDLTSKADVGKNKTHARTFDIIRVKEGEGLIPNEPEGDKAFFFALNKIAGGSRGTPDLLSTIDWLEGLDGFVFSLLERADVAQSIVYDLLIENANEKEVRKKTESFTKALKSGGVYGHNQRTSLDIKTANLGASEAETVTSVMLRQIYAGTGQAGLFFGDSDDLTRASASEISVPVAKRFQARQNFIRGMVEFMLSYQIQIGLKFGVISRDADLRFEVKMGRVYMRDLETVTGPLNELATSLQVAEDRQWISSDLASKTFKTALNEANLVDPDIDDENEDERAPEEKEVADMMQKINGDGAVPGAPGAVKTVSDIAFNGAQVTAAADIVKSVALREIPRESGVALLVALFNFPDQTAEKIVGSAGTGPAPVTEESGAA